MSRKWLLLLATVSAVATGLIVGALIGSSSAVTVAVATALAGLATLVPGLFFIHRLRRYTQGLAEAIKQATRGNYGHKVYAMEGPELGELAIAFNTMSERLAEQFARVEEDRRQLHAILSGMVEGVVSIDAQQRLLFANEAGARMLDFHPKMAIGRKLWEVIRHKPILALVDRALETRHPQQDELDWKGPNIKNLSVYAAPFAEQDGQGAILVLHDNSVLRRLERLRSEFVANVSHELKTPLAVIKACVETLQVGAIDDVEHRGAFLDQINDNADRLHNLILDLMSLARIESAVETLDIQTVTIAELVRECVERFRPQAESKHLLIEVNTPKEPSAAVMRTDEDSLRNILDNLLDNSVKYTPDGGRILVSWYGRGDQMCFEVEDTGIGIPEDDLPRIFERFYRVDKARSRELGGTGLGLSIVKNLAHLLRGSVTVSSRLGKGSKFTVSLPRSAT